MDYLRCLEHDKPISHIDINVNTLKGKRALCSHCQLINPIPVEIALNKKKEKLQEEQHKYIEFFSQFLSPLQEKIKSLDCLKNDFCKAIQFIEENLKKERDRITCEKQTILKSMNIDFQYLTISQLQSIGEELSQNNFSCFEKDKINFVKQFDEILNCQELTLISEIKIILDKIQQSYQRQEFLKNLNEGHLSFHPFKQQQFKFDCYASAINEKETLMVVSHNIELILFEITQKGLHKIDMINNFGFFYEIVFDKNDENLLYLADYNSSFRVVRIENYKMNILNTSIKFDQSVTCLVCSKNSEVLVSSKDLSFKSYKLINDEITLVQDIGIDKEISSINLNHEETLMATSHTNYHIKIWQKQDNMWIHQQDICTNQDKMLLSASQLRVAKDRNAVCLLKNNILAYLSDTGILRFYKKDDAGLYQYLSEFQYPIDKNNHFPSTYTLRFNYLTGLLACHQYNNLQVFRQNQDGEIYLFQEFSNIKHQIVGCQLSKTFLVAQDSQNFIFHILKLTK